MRSFTLLALLMLASPTFAEDAAYALPYAEFEFSVPHVDLETCPDGITDIPSFCRATLASDEIHIFAFAEDGDNHLVALQSFPADGLTSILEN